MTITGAANPDRMVVETTDKAAQEIRPDLGDNVVVEPQTFFFPNN